MSKGGVQLKVNVPGKQVEVKEAVSHSVCMHYYKSASVVRPVIVRWPKFTQSWRAVITKTRVHFRCVFTLFG